MLKFGFTNETEEKVTKTLFKRRIEKFYEILRSKIDKKLNNRNGLIDLVLINDETIKAMNGEYRRKNSPTDVISFAYLEVTEHESEKGDIIAGDIFISVDTAKKQAKKKGHDLKREIEILFVHGLLHCFGFGHKTDKQENEMEKWAKKVLT
ncbi:MAG: rRNA maturation RNase YbeY [bacterium]|nr:rRNA maturation RNase YbeY [bacterium]